MKPTPSRSSSTALRLAAAAAVPCVLAASAAAQTTIYHIPGNAAAGSNDIWAVDTTSGTERLVYTNYPGGNAATLTNAGPAGATGVAVSAPLPAGPTLIAVNLSAGTYSIAAGVCSVRFVTRIR